MIPSRIRRWLTICSLTGWVACSGDAAAPHRVVAPTRPPPRSAPTAAPEPTPAIALVADPAVAPITEPPPAVAPVVALPPCPGDPGRDEHQKLDHVVQLVELSESMTVVDLGSGDGYLLCRLSRAVGARGRVIATEISETLVRKLKQRVAREQLTNVEVLRAPTDDVGIAPGAADRILLVNVWHHLPARKRYATRVARALAPGGKVVIVDFKPRGRRSKHGIAPERVLAELAAGSIEGTLAAAEQLPAQYVIIGVVRSAGGAAPPSPARAAPAR